MRQEEKRSEEMIDEEHLNKINECEILCKAMSFELTEAKDHIGELNKMVAALDERCAILTAFIERGKTREDELEKDSSWLRSAYHNLKQDLDTHLISHLKRGKKR
jgi:hypothetical protein